MSYFGRDLLAHLTDADHCSIEQAERDVEIADGVVVERRSVLWLSAGAVASLLVGGAALRAQDPQPQGKPARPDQLTFEQFLEQIHPLARRVVASNGADEEAYLMTVAAAMSRLADPAAPLGDAMREFARSHRQPDERFPLSAASMRLKPGGGFEHHDHLNYNGVILGVEGEVRVRNFDFVGEAPAIDSRATFQIRQTRDDLILPGRFSSLGRTRENIHELVAGKDGARVLDVFTFFAKDATSRYLDVEAQPRDAEARIHDAVWRPRRR